MPNPNTAVLVTGASRGLGAAIARQLDALGCRTLLAARSADKLNALKAELNHAEVMPCDLSDLAATQKLVARAVERFGRLDAVINNAGVIQPIKPLAEADPQQWQKAITVNLTSPALLMASALPHLSESGGRIVNISSGAAVKVMQGWSAYCTSKAGLLHLSAIVAEEYPKVGVFSLRPGVIDTEMQTEIRDSDGMQPKDLAKFQDLKAKGELEPPEVPARAAVWLALQGPLKRSGEFLQYTDDEVQQGVQDLFADLTVSGGKV